MSRQVEPPSPRAGEVSHHRVEPRVRVDLELTVRASTPYRLRSRDLSASGAYAWKGRQALALERARPVRLDFQFGGRPLQLPAEVVRIERHGVAFRFIEPSDDNRLAIRSEIWRRIYARLREGPGRKPSARVDRVVDLDLTSLF